MRRRRALPELTLTYCWLIVAGAIFIASSAAGAAQAATVIKDIPYYGSSGAAKGDRRQSLDLYLPAQSGTKPPLMIFVHGGYWLIGDDEYRIGPYIADVLTHAGVAVALVRYRLAPAAPHPSQAEDVAAATAHLLRQSQRYGIDSQRVFLAGHSAGGHLASLVALDPTFLRKHGVSPKAVAGVISFSGLYDLTPRWPVTEDQRVATKKTFGDNPAILKQAAPIRHVRSGAPPFLILTAETDFLGFALDAKRFSDALERAGKNQVQRWIVSERDHFTLMRLGDRENEARMLLLDFLEVAPLPSEFKILVDAKRRWREPPFSTLPFWRHEKLIRAYPVDQRFVNRMAVVYGSLAYELKGWPLENYYAIPLSAYLDALPAQQVGRGDYLITTNIRHEKQFWKLAQIGNYNPVIVVGLDDERNMFRLGVFYRAFREYSWKGGAPPPLMARPLGAFIHFQKEPPPDVSLHPAQFALTTDSFRLAPSDPLAGLRDLPEALYDVVTRRNGCVYCHVLRGLGSHSHHILAGTGIAYGGEALPLEDYPPEVWRAFIFDQVNVAKKIGASPNLVAEETRQDLFDLVTRLRKSANKR